MGDVTPVRAVVFDIGKVLIDWDIRFLYEKLIPDPATREWFLHHVLTPQWHDQHDLGRRAEDTTAELKAQFPAYSAWIDAYVPRWLETIGGLVPGIDAVMDDLDARGVPLFAVTNFSAEFWPRFAAAYPITQKLRDVVVSGVEKIAKPDPRIYTLALRRFGLQAGDAIFIDDRLQNVIAAEENGFIGHHFRDAHALRAALVEIGLLS